MPTKSSPKLSTLPANYQVQVNDLVTRLSGNKNKYTTLAICSTPSVSNHVKSELHGGNGELRLDTLDKPKELFINWSDYSYFNPSHGATTCPQVLSLMQQVEAAKAPNLNTNKEGIVITDPALWVKAILKAGLTIYNPTKLPAIQEYVNRRPIDVDTSLKINIKSPSKIDILDTESGKIVKTEVSEVEGKQVKAGTTYIYKYLRLADGSIPCMTESQKPALVWGNESEKKAINAEWKEIRKLVTPVITR